MKAISEKGPKEKEEKYAQVPLDQIDNAEQALDIYARHWDKRERVKVEGFP